MMDFWKWVGELTGHWAVAVMVRKSLFLASSLSTILSLKMKNYDGRGRSGW
jgi:hypothetical protein